MNNIGHCAIVQDELIRESLRGHYTRFVQSTKFYDDGFSQTNAGMLFTTFESLRAQDRAILRPPSGTPPKYHIAGVFLGVPEIQMLWVAAGRVIARMQDPHGARSRPMMKFPRNPVSLYGLSISGHDAIT